MLVGDWCGGDMKVAGAFVVLVDWANSFALLVYTCHELIVFYDNTHQRFMSPSLT